MLSRILLVEDIEGTRRNLETLIHMHICGCIVESARFVEDALQLIQRSQADYDVAILDFQLPVRMGEAVEVNDEVCCLLKATAPKVAVAHCSSFLGHPKVQAHLDKHHAGRPEDIHAFPAYSKSNANYAQILVDDLKSYIYGKRLGRQIDALFGIPDPSMRSALVDSVTNPLSTLCRDIANYWKFLKIDSDRKKIQAHFEITSVGTTARVQVSLL